MTYLSKTSETLSHDLFIVKLTISTVLQEIYLWNTLDFTWNSALWEKFNIDIDLFWEYDWELGPKKNTLVSRNAGDEKNCSLAAAIFFFNRFSGDILFSYLVSFAFFAFLFFFLLLLLSFFVLLFFLLVYLIFEIKNIYSDTHWAMRAGEW